MQSPPPPPPSGGYPPPPPPPPGGYAPPPQMPGGAYPPQAYAPQVRYGGFWIRVVAYIIDGILLSVVGWIIDLVLGVNPADPSTGPYALIQLVIGIAYFVGLWTYQGASLGQRIFKLRVVDVNTGQPISIGKGLLRYLGLVVSTLACFIGLIWVAFDARKQGWADKIAGTLVIQG